MALRSVAGALSALFRVTGAFHGPAEIAHGWFDAHATKFSSGLQKLLDAHATVATFGFELLPRVKANVPPEVVQPPRSREAPVGAPSSRPVTGAVAGTPPRTTAALIFDVAVSFTGSQRQVAETVATKVRDAGFDVFYDRFFPEQP